MVGQSEGLRSRPSKVPLLMRLLIISHTPHYFSGQQIVGLAATVREIDHLSSLFDSVIHLAPLHLGTPPLNTLLYGSLNVTLRLVAPAGGQHVLDKLKILYRLPSYVKAIAQELPRADVVHVRCPANISLLAIVMLAFVRQPHLRWVKYAGNWQPTRREPWSYSFQRWWLRKGFHRGFVTVNGEWPNQPAHVRPFVNPCITDEELCTAAEVARSKTLSDPLRLLFVGALNEAKGVGRALHIVQRLHQRNLPILLDVVGDGSARGKFERLAHELGVAHCVRFHGAQSREILSRYYAEAHLMLFPTGSSEGWPKVLSEGMAYGVVPVSGNVSSIPHYLSRFRIGRALDPYNIDAFVDAIEQYWSQPDLWEQEAQRGPDAAQHFTYSAYLRDVRKMLGLSESVGSQPQIRD